MSRLKSILSASRSITARCCAQIGFPRGIVPFSLRKNWDSPRLIFPLPLNINPRMKQRIAACLPFWKSRSTEPGGLAVLVWNPYKFLRLSALAFACWAAVQAPALAQAAKEEVDDKGGNWVMPYALVLMGIGLGLLVVLRSSRRRDRAKPEQYAEGKDYSDPES